MDAILPIVEEVLARQKVLSPERTLLVGLSGIDGSGKGYVAAHLVEALQRHGLRTAAINVDGWLNLPPVRFDAARSAAGFYARGLRLDEMFERLILPLCRERRARLAMDWVDETATVARPHTYDFADVDVVVLEGIFLYKWAYRPHFDLAAWIDCTWETALTRAVARSQEGLGEAETVAAYRTTFFPAQEIHFARDDPRRSADLVIGNDPRLEDHPAAGA